MRKISLLLLLLLPLLVLGSCRVPQETPPKEGDLQLALYYLNEGGENSSPRKLVPHQTTISQGETPQATVENILLRMKQAENYDKAPAIPEGVVVSEVIFYGNSVIVNLSPEFSELLPIEKTLTASAIALTLTQLDSVSFVKISCATQNYDSTNDFYLNADSIILNESAVQFNAFEVSIYLVNRDTRQLEKVTRIIKSEEQEVYPNALFNELMRQPESDWLEAPVPQGTMLRSITTSNGVCVLDFVLQEAETLRGMDELSVSAIVATLCAQDGVRGVELRIDGLPLSGYGITGYDGVLTTKK